MPKRKSEADSGSRKKARKEIQSHDISKLLKKRKAARKPTKPSASDEWFTSLSRGQNEIDPIGIEQLCTQLALAPDSLEILYLAWKMEAKRMGYFSKEEWNRANAHFRIETPQKLSDDLRTTVRGLTFLTQDAKMLHRFGFDFCRDEGKKILDKDTAQVMLRCLMDNRWSLIDVFNAYFQNSTYRGMNKDQWNNVFEFAKVHGSLEDISQYDPNAAWPVMMDEFVDFLKTSREEKM